MTTTAHRPLVEHARTARDEGIAVAEHAADPRLRLMIDDLIAKANATGQPWSANDIRDQVPVVGQGLVGARINAAAMRRPAEMTKVGETPSTLRSTHAKRITVYVGVTTTPAPATVDATWSAVMTEHLDAWRAIGAFRKLHAALTAAVTAGDWAAARAALVEADTHHNWSRCARRHELVAALTGDTWTHPEPDPVIPS